MCCLNCGEVISAAFPGAQKPTRNHPHAVTIPGAVDGYLTLLERFGRWGIDRVIAPAQRYAADGFPAWWLEPTQYVRDNDALRPAPPGSDPLELCSKGTLEQLLDGATEVQCGVLSEEASLELLLRAGGCEELLEDPPDAAREAVEICGRLLVRWAQTQDTVTQLCRWLRLWSTYPSRRP